MNRTCTCSSMRKGVRETHYETPSNFGIATMPRVKSDTKYTLWRDFAVGWCAKFQIFRIYDSFWTLHAWFWKLFCFLLKFLVKKCYKDRFTYKIYNMAYFYVRGGVSGPAPFRWWGRSINPGTPVHLLVYHERREGLMAIAGTTIDRKDACIFWLCAEISREYYDGGGDWIKYKVT